MINYVFRQPQQPTQQVKREAPKLDSQIKFEKEQKEIQTIENNLLNLQMEKKKISMEYDKIPDSGIFIQLTFYSKDYCSEKKKGRFGKRNENIRQKYFFIKEKAQRDASFLIKVSIMN